MPDLPASVAPRLQAMLRGSQPDAEASAIVPAESTASAQLASHMSYLQGLASTARRETKAAQEEETVQEEALVAWSDETS